MAAPGAVVVRILGDASSLKKGLAESEAALDGFSAKAKNMGDKLTRFGAKMTAGVTLPIVAGLGLATKAAADEDQAIAGLAQTMKKTTGATDAQVKANEKWITRMQNATGIMDDKLRPAMQKLLIAGRNVEQSHHDLAIAADIAAARHVDLETVVQAMSKAAQGNTGALGRLGIATKDAAGKTLSYDQILQNASKTMGGAAATAADTAAGKMAIMKAKFADAEENIGNALIPVLTSLTDWLGKLASWFNSLSPTTQKVIVVMGLLAAAIGPVVTVVGALITAVGFLAANPVVLLIAAIAALVLGLVYAYNHFKTFHDIVNTVARFIKDNLIPVLLFLASGGTLIIGAALVYAYEHFKPLRDIVNAVVDVVMTLVGALVAVGAWLGHVADVSIGKIIGALQTLWGWASKVIDVLGRVVSIANGVVGKVGGVIGKIPGFAAGGTVPGPIGAPMLAVVHGGEQVIPNGGGGGGSMVVQVYLDNQAIVNSLVKYDRRNGGIKIRATG